jgi:nitrate reductase gamma subunit
MNAYIDHLVFGIYPYIALSVLVIGSIIRFDREPYSWRSGSASSCGASS